MTPQPKAANPLTAAEQAAVLTLAPVVSSQARRLLRRAPAALTLADLEGFGWCGAIDAVKRYRPDGPATLNTYATPRIIGAIRDGIRGWTPVGARRRPEYFRRSEALADDEPALAVESGPATDHADEVEARLRRLRPREAAVIRCRLRGQTLRQAGEAVGVSESRASQLQAAALELLTGSPRPAGYVTVRRAAA